MVNKIVLDTNVFISAIVFGGKPRRILEAIIRGRLNLAVSEYILEEIKFVLAGRKFRFPPQVVQAVISEITNLAEIVDPRVKISTIKKDPADNRVLECAVESKADYIVSGDVHLLALGSFKGIYIVNPAEFIGSVL